MSIGHSYALAGEPDAAVSFLEKGFQLNPQDPRNHMYFAFMARAHLTARRYETAAEWAQRAVHWRQDAPLPRLARPGRSSQPRETPALFS